MTRWNYLLEHTMAMAAGKRPPVSLLNVAQRRDEAPLPATECSTRHLLDPSARADNTPSPEGRSRVLRI